MNQTMVYISQNSVLSVCLYYHLVLFGADDTVGWFDLIAYGFHLLLYFKLVGGLMYILGLGCLDLKGGPGLKSVSISPAKWDNSYKSKYDGVYAAESRETSISGGLDSGIHPHATITVRNYYRIPSKINAFDRKEVKLNKLINYKLDLWSINY